LVMHLHRLFLVS